MTDSTNHSLAGLLETGSTEAFDWDPSALVEWPNIAPSSAPATILSAEPSAGHFDQAL